MNPDPRLDNPYDRRIDQTPYDQRMGYPQGEGGATYWIVGGLVAVVLAAGIFIFTGTRTESPPSTAQAPSTERQVTPVEPPAAPTTPAPMTPAPNPANPTR